METFLLKLLRNLDPEQAHRLGLSALDVLSSIPTPFINKPISSEISALGLLFPNPVGLAAGFDKDGAHIAGFQKLGFGFIEVGTVTPLPQSGNPKPRLFRIPNEKAILNRMGFNNSGIDNLILNIKKLKNKRIPIGINIGANKNTPEENRIDDYLKCFDKAYGNSDYITINISSPNTKNLRSLQRVEDLSKMLERLDHRKKELIALSKRDIPILLKIAPDLEENEITDIAQICIVQNIAGIIGTNTTISRDGINEPYANETGGLSGKPLLKKSLKVISTLNKVTENKLTLIGCGGIITKQDALEFKKQGASLVQIYTGLVYEGSKLIREIAENWE